MKRLSWIFILMILPFISNAQAGMWEAYKVTAGKHEMTPHAKWMHFKADGSYVNGNGWAQNDHGTWSWDEKTKTFHPKSALTHDPAGPFKVLSLTADEMVWQREEEVMQVTVYLRKIEEKPAALWDKIQGIWSLNQGDTDGQILQASTQEQEAILYLAWDRRYRKINWSEGNERGIWYMHPHRLHLTLINHDNSRTQWKVMLEGEMLSLEGIGDNNKGKILKFDRRMEFPN